MTNRLLELDAARQLGVDRKTMVVMLDTLETKKLVARQPDPSDRRRNTVQLTDTGRRTLRRGVTASDGAERDLLAELSPQAADELRNSLRTILALTGSRATPQNPPATGA